MRLAAYRYSKGTLSERLDRMMDEEVLPNACSVNTDVFRERLASDAVKAVFDKHKKNLKIIYKVFAADDNSDEGALSQDTMNAQELVSFNREVKMIGPLLSEKAVRTIFAYVQQEEEELDEGEGGDVGDSEMVYAEFTEALGGIACIMEPDPYNVVPMRLDWFLDRKLMPNAKALPRFRGKGLK